MMTRARQAVGSCTRSSSRTRPSGSIIASMVVSMGCSLHVSVYTTLPVGGSVDFVAAWAAGMPFGGIGEAWHSGGGDRPGGDRRAATVHRSFWRSVLPPSTTPMQCWLARSEEHTSELQSPYE